MCKEKINLTDKYTTRDGRPVRVLCVDRKGIYPVVALVTTGPDSETTAVYNATGGYWNDGSTNYADLIKFDPLEKFRNLPVDTPVWVLDSAKGWLPRHFACTQNSYVLCYKEGKTSHTLGGTHPWSIDQVSLTKPEGA